MKPFALNLALRPALRTLGRFPLVYASALIGTVAALWLNHLPPPEVDARTVAANLLMAAWLGVGLFFSLAILVESRRWPLWGAFAIQAAGLAALAAYHYSL